MRISSGHGDTLEPRHRDRDRGACQQPKRGEVKCWPPVDACDARGRTDNGAVVCDDASFTANDAVRRLSTDEAVAPSFHLSTLTPSAMHPPPLIARRRWWSLASIIASTRRQNESHTGATAKPTARPYSAHPSPFQRRKGEEDGIDRGESRREDEQEWEDTGGGERRGRRRLSWRSRYRKK